MSVLHPRKQLFPNFLLCAFYIITNGKLSIYFAKLYTTLTQLYLRRLNNSSIIKIHIRDYYRIFLIEGRNSSVQWHTQTRGVWGHANLGNFGSLRPLRLFLVSHAQMKSYYISHSTICISIILGNFRGGRGESWGASPQY